MNVDSQPKHWRDPDSSVSSRSSYKTNYEKSELKISSIKLSDTGRYKCRVDYHLEQTSFQLIDLIVIVPPDKPRIFYNGDLVRDNRIYLKENRSTTLHCESKGDTAEINKSFINLSGLGGLPSPTLTWWKDNHLIDESFQR